MKSLIAASLFTLLASSATAAPRTHDGFYLRLAIGAGYESLNIDGGSSGSELGLGGFGGGTSIALGGMVTENLAINADIFAGVVVNPSVTQNGEDIGDTNDTSVSLAAFGVGATYYFMPINLYVAGSIGVGTATITVEGLSFESDPGLAANIMVGKEFWVGREWGIGIAGQFIFANIPTTADDSSATFTAFNLMFSATFN